MLSSKDGLFDRARGRMVGSEQYLTKPFTKDELLGAIHSHVVKYRSQGRRMALIMIVDDSPTEVHVLKTALEKHGFDTVSATDGAECLSLAREVRPGPHLHGRRDARVNGFQATRSLTRDPQTKSIPVVMITTKDQESDRVWGMRQGAVDYLVKPVTEAVLVAKAQEVLDRGQPS